MSPVSRRTALSPAALQGGVPAPPERTGRLQCYRITPAAPGASFLAYYDPQIGIPADGEAPQPVALSQ